MRLGFGCVNLGSAGAQRTVRADVRLVQEAMDRGVRVFDTADAYGNGASERILGRALRGRRDDVVLATKGGYVFRERLAIEQAGRRTAARVIRAARRSGAGGGRPAGSGGDAYQQRADSSRHLRTAIEASLRRLRTDHVDVYQLHGPHEVLPSLFDELQDVVAAGKVGCFGIGAESVSSAVAWLDVPAVRTLQVPFGVLDPEAATELLAHRPGRPVDVWVRGVLGGGLLAKASRDLDSVAGDPKAPTIARLDDLARRSGTALDALAVGYVRSFPGVSTVLLGISSRAHLDRNVALMGAPPLPADVHAELLAIAAAAGVIDGGP